MIKTKLILKNYNNNLNNFRLCYKLSIIIYLIYISCKNNKIKNKKREECSLTSRVCVCTIQGSSKNFISIL